MVCCNALASSQLVINESFERAIINQHAELSLAFIAENPPTADSTDENWPAPDQAVKWHDLGSAGLTRLIDLSDDPVFGKYLVVKWSCPQGNCYNT